MIVFPHLINNNSTCLAKDDDDDDDTTNAVTRKIEKKPFWYKILRRKEERKEEATTIIPLPSSILSSTTDNETSQQPTTRTTPITSFYQDYDDDDDDDDDDYCDDNDYDNLDERMSKSIAQEDGKNDEDNVILTKTQPVTRFWHKILRRREKKAGTHIIPLLTTSTIISSSHAITCQKEDNDDDDDDDDDDDADNGKEQHAPYENDEDRLMNPFSYYYSVTSKSVTTFVSSFLDSFFDEQEDKDDDQNSSRTTTSTSSKSKSKHHHSIDQGTCDNNRKITKVMTRMKGGTKKTKKKKTKKKNQRQEQQQSPSSSSSLFSITIHLLFGILCLIEMVIRSVEARRMVFEHEAITAFEDKFAETIARVYSRRRLLKGKNNYGSVSAFFFNNLTTNQSSSSSSSSSKWISSLTTTDQTQFKLNPYLPSAFYPSSPSRRTKPTTVHRCRDVVVDDDSDNDEDGDANDNNHNADHNSVDATADSDDHGDDIHHAMSSDDEFDEDKDNCHDYDHQEEEEVMNKKHIVVFLRSTFRLWIPVGVTCIFWLSLLPFYDYWNKLRTVYDETAATTTDWNWNLSCIESDEETSLATIWITNFMQQWKETTNQMQDYVVSTFWDRIIWEYNAVFHPKLFWNRINKVLEVVKWVRFAGPLMRMFLKLFDQFVTLFGTYKNVKSSNAQREKRMNRPSIMLRDLRRIESFHKVETTIASWPSHCSVLLDIAKESLGKYGIASSSSSTTGSGSNDDSSSSNKNTVRSSNYAEQFIAKNRIRGQQITQRIQNLQNKLRRSVTEFSSSEIYDSIVKLTSDINCRNILDDDDDDDDHDRDKDSDYVIDNNNNNNNSPRSTSSSNDNIDNDKKNRRHRHRRHRTSSISSNSWYDYFHLGTLLGSRDYLISPRSRFSVFWRITVTNCLLLELARLFVSWHLTQTFHLSVTQVISRSLVDCAAIPEKTKQHFKFFTDQIDEWHVQISHAIPFIPYPKEKLLTLCAQPTSRSSRLLLQLGSMLESFIDVVSFMDIFFWFFTGDLDGQTGIVIPKPFIGRCIIPGTLVQVIDHPTLPKVLPAILDRIIETTIIIGWSRVIRWIVAIVPALLLIVVQPFNAYFFRHFDEDKTATGDEDLLMSYAESFGYLPQRRTSFTTTIPSDINITSPVATKIAIATPRRSLGNKLSDIADDWEEDEEDDESGIDFDDARPVQSQPPTVSSSIRSSLKTSDLYGNSNTNNNNITTALEDYSSNIRFANYLSKQQTNNITDGIVHDDDDTLHSSMGFDIGLSLSSHALDDLH